MRIAFILGSSTYQQSLYKVTQDVAKEIERKGHSVEFVFWENPGALSNKDKCLKIFGLSKEAKSSKFLSKLFTSILGKHFYYYIFSYFFYAQLKKNINTDNYDAIFFHGQSCIPMRACKLNHYVVVHSCKYENLINRHHGIKKYFYTRLYKKIYSDKNLLTVSQDVKKDMLVNVGAQPRSIEVIYNGFNFNRLATETLSSMSDNLPDTFIMSAGRPDRTKRFDILLRAYAKTKKQHPLVIFGDGKRLNSLRALSKELGISNDVIFPGFCANILPAFRHAKLYVSSSDVEGLPTVIVESLAAGTPVVATDAGGSYELLRNDLSKWIVPKGNTDALARAIDDILEDPPVVSSKNIDFLDHQRIAKRYIDLSKQLKGQALITFEDITVVVQGPVQALNGREQEQGITHKCLSSVRAFLPGAHIILSTWPGQQLSGLDYDELVISEDPGPNIRKYQSDGRPRYYNNNRQIVSTLAGLKQVSTPYAIKLRSDNYLAGNQFVALQRSFPHRDDSHLIFQERVVVSNVFTRKYAKGFRVAFHLSDFFYFGLTEDLIAIWDLPLFEDITPNEAAEARALAKGFLIDCTQMFWLRTLNKFDPSITLDGLLDNTPEKLEQSDHYYANNLVIAAPEELGVNLGEKFSGNARIARERGRCAQWQFFEWQDAYRRYCQPSFKPSTTLRQRFSLQVARLIYVFPTRIENLLKIIKH